MKKITSFLLLTVTQFSYTQAVSSIVPICDGRWYDEVPQNSYFKDIENKLAPFVGTWIYVNGNEKLTIAIRKVTKRYYPEKKIFKDFLVGNYSYSTDGGSTYVVNTIPYYLDTDPNANPLYASCVDETIAEFNFIDVVLDKHRCRAIFEFVAGSMTQFKLTLKNPEGGRAVLIQEGETYVPTPPGFTIPNNVILTKQ